MAGSTKTSFGRRIHPRVAEVAGRVVFPEDRVAFPEDRVAGPGDRVAGPEDRVKIGRGLVRASVPPARGRGSGREAGVSRLAGRVVFPEDRVAFPEDRVVGPEDRVAFPEDRVVAGGRSPRSDSWSGR
jgi:hypothetical protein